MRVCKLVQEFRSRATYSFEINFTMTAYVCGPFLAPRPKNTNEDASNSRLISPNGVLTVPQLVNKTLVNLVALQL